MVASLAIAALLAIDSEPVSALMGCALEGATLRQDLDDNATPYGKKMENRDIVRNGIPPRAAAKLMALLNRYSFREKD